MEEIWNLGNKWDISVKTVRSVVISKVPMLCFGGKYTTARSEADTKGN